MFDEQQQVVRERAIDARPSRGALDFEGFGVRERAERRDEERAGGLHKYTQSSLFVRRATSDG
jgi:hypothetical protein